MMMHLLLCFQFLIISLHALMLPTMIYGLILQPNIIHHHHHGASTRSYKHLHYFAAQRNSIDDTKSCSSIDRQSDNTKYGRGIDHISADINPGDIIAYQAGTWYVDGLSEVGDGSPPIVKYLLVDTIQLVWSHDCEHGVINGFDLTIVNNNESDDGSDIHAEESNGVVIEKDRSHFVANQDEYVQIGPEQILARIPAKAYNSEDEKWIATVDFYPDDEVMILDE